MRRLIPFSLLVLLAFPALAAPQTYLQFSSGTGFFIDPDGHVITNAHVVQRCQSVEVRTDQGVLPATILAMDTTRDLAVLKTPGPAPAVAPLRLNINELNPGDPVVVYGFPGASGASGNASYVKTTVVGLHGPSGEPQWLQLQSVAQQGNSGGPVLDNSGHVIAVIAGRAETYKIPTTTGGKPELVSKADIAVTLASLQEFLAMHQIPFYQEASGLVAYGDDLLVKNSRQFIAPVRCVQGIVTRAD